MAAMETGRGEGEEGPWWQGMCTGEGMGIGYCMTESQS